MTVAPLPQAARGTRAPQQATDAATGAADGADPDTAAAQAQQRALAARSATFDLAAKERAEDERERAALEQLMLAQLKDEDEVMKKWIAMI